jgi:hypothetical protein
VHTMYAPMPPLEPLMPAVPNGPRLDVYAEAGSRYGKNVLLLRTPCVRMQAPESW